MNSGVKGRCRDNRNKELFTLTKNDSKILGNVSKRLQKTLPPDIFRTKNFQTQYSNWTPVANKSANDQIFLERKELVCNWFDLWTDSQRKLFLAQMLYQCKRSQHAFIQNWFSNNVPLRHVDLTRVLPRFLVLYIFSFLDPRSLCRASGVCWYWRFLAEQDILWQTKCVKYGWFLPFTPEDAEYGAWKRHYVACLKTLNFDRPSPATTSKYCKTGNDSYRGRNRLKTRLTVDQSVEVLSLRPPWMPNDKSPKDLDNAAKAMKGNFNPNTPIQQPYAMLHHDRWGFVKKTVYSDNFFSKSMDAAVSSSSTLKLQVPSADMGMDDDIKNYRQMLALSESIHMESMDEKRLTDLIHQPWDSPKKKIIAARANLSGGGAYPIPWKHSLHQPVSKTFPNQMNPRIIFISSRVPAADVLVDAINFGVIPIVYEYEGTTLRSLMSQLEHSLQGRLAKSIGFFPHSDTPDEIRIVHRGNISIDNLDEPDFIEFFEFVTNSVLPKSKEGHIDIFLPLASSESGTELLVQLGSMTDMYFTAPSGVTGKYNHVNGEWLSSPEATLPPEHYFEKSKFNVWMTTADEATEACMVTKRELSKYFLSIHRDIVSQLTGQIVFDAMGQVDLQGVNEVGSILLEALVAMSTQKNVKPAEFLGQYLLQKAGHYDVGVILTSKGKQKQGDTLFVAPTLSAKTLSAHLSLSEKFDDSLLTSENTDDGDSEVAAITLENKEHKNSTNKMQQVNKNIARISDDISVDGIEEEDNGKMAAIHGNGKVSNNKDKDNAPDKNKDKNSLGKTNLQPMRSRSPKGAVFKQISLSSSNSHLKLSNGLTAEALRNQPERRAAIAKEILSSEIRYMKTLDAIVISFYNPLKSALTSNRAILSAQNIQIIFQDILLLLDLSRKVLSNLRPRLADWSPQQCLGDVFVKFGKGLNIYSNYLNNYPVILANIERCLEQIPSFRAFLKRHERTPFSKMLTLPKLMLEPMKRVEDYVNLLTWFQKNTPSDHVDRANIASALTSFRELQRLVSEHKRRIDHHREMMRIQKSIINCPILLEGSRQFLKHLDVTHVKAPMESVIPELRVYQHIGVIGLYLFNDSLVVTHRSTHNAPYQRSVEYIYRFETCVGLTRLKVEDLPDSKYLKNAFKIYTPKRKWICSTEDFTDKFNWTTLLESTINAQIM